MIHDRDRAVGCRAFDTVRPPQRPPTAEAAPVLFQARCQNEEPEDGAFLCKGELNGDG